MAKKLPKSMGACADLYYDARQKRLAADKVAAELKAEENRIANHIIDNLSKDDTGAAGKHHRVQVKRERKWRVGPENWSKFHAWVRKNNRFDFLQKRVSEEAIKEYLATSRGGKAPPGMEPYDYVKISLTKV